LSSPLVVATSAAPIDSIAVLPFVNASNDPDADYLSDGITESLINSLSQLPHIKVIARSSVFRYKGKETDPQTAAKELNVQALMSGRVAQRGDSLAISVELIDARDNTHLWGQQFTRKTSDIFALQEEIARQVSENLRVKLSRADEERVTKRYTVDEEAYKLYLLGRSYWNRRTGESLKKAIEYFNQAIAKDPSYALAYAGLADTYTALPAYGVGQPKETNRKAKAAALRALELDNTLADPHAALATILAFSDWNWSAAEDEFKRAIALNSNYATAHQWYAEFLLNVGRMEEGIAESKRAQELDPLSLIISKELGTNLFFAKQYDAAMVQLQKTLAMDANFVPACIDLGFVYERKGMYEQAIPMFQKAISLEGDNTFALSGLGYTYARWGRKKEALAALERMMKFTKQKYVSANEVATIYVGLDEVDKAFVWLERGYAEHDDFLAFLKVHPPFDSIRSDPRFVDLMRRVGLPR
jgi:TolB-like protein/Tfp pilus assembly protein PilF